MHRMLLAELVNITVDFLMCSIAFLKVRVSNRISVFMQYSLAIRNLIVRLNVVGILVAGYSLVN